MPEISLRRCQHDVTIEFYGGKAVRISFDFRGPVSLYHALRAALVFQRKAIRNSEKKKVKRQGKVWKRQK